MKRILKSDDQTRRYRLVLKAYRRQDTRRARHAFKSEISKILQDEMKSEALEKQIFEEAVESVNYQVERMLFDSTYESDNPFVNGDFDEFGDPNSYCQCEHCTGEFNQPLSDEDDLNTDEESDPNFGSEPDQWFI